MTADALRPREQRVAAALVEAFAGDFPADILAVRAGDPLDADAPVPDGAPHARRRLRGRLVARQQPEPSIR